MTFYNFARCIETNGVPDRRGEYIYGTAALLHLLQIMDTAEYQRNIGTTIARGKVVVDRLFASGAI